LFWTSFNIKGGFDEHSLVGPSSNTRGGDTQVRLPDGVGEAGANKGRRIHSGVWALLSRDQSAVIQGSYVEAGQTAEEDVGYVPGEVEHNALHDLFANRQAGLMSFVSELADCAVLEVHIRDFSSQIGFEVIHNLS
jgi:hypothetical protein